MDSPHPNPGQIYLLVSPLPRNIALIEGGGAGVKSSTFRKFDNGLSVYSGELLQANGATLADIARTSTDRYPVVIAIPTDEALHVVATGTGADGEMEVQQYYLRHDPNPEILPSVVGKCHCLLVPVIKSAESIKDIIGGDKAYFAARASIVFGEKVAIAFKESRIDTWADFRETDAGKLLLNQLDTQ